LIIYMPKINPKSSTESSLVSVNNMMPQILLDKVLTGVTRIKIS